MCGLKPKLVCYRVLDRVSFEELNCMIGIVFCRALATLESRCDWSRKGREAVETDLLPTVSAVPASWTDVC